MEARPTRVRCGVTSVIRLGNVSKPSLTAHLAPRDKSTGASVVVCPGRGYSIPAMDLEGTEVAEWLNGIGVTAVLLKYRVPAHKDRERYAAPLQDAQRAMDLVREHAKEWGIDPKLGLTSSASCLPGSRSFGEDQGHQPGGAVGAPRKRLVAPPHTVARLVVCAAVGARSAAPPEGPPAPAPRQHFFCG